MKNYKLSNQAHQRLRKKHLQKLEIRNDLHEDEQTRAKAIYHSIVQIIQSQEKKVMPLKNKRIVYKHCLDNSGWGYDMQYLDETINSNLMNRK